VTAAFASPEVLACGPLVDDGAADALRDALAALLESGAPRATLDLGGARRLPGTALVALAAFCRTIADRGGRAQLVASDVDVSETLHAAGFAALADIVP
jgi:anti-anti-sigma regulatory factor